MDGEDVRFRQVKYALVLIIVFIVFVFVSLDATGLLNKDNSVETNKDGIVDPSSLSPNEKVDAGLVIEDLDYHSEIREDESLLTSGDEEETIISGENLSGEAN